ncbi:BrnT family toxin [Marinomonas sp. TI.3.20]|uniref:BrnT family toxin n=1 Tax=Marinomonas sp. TI.3.20 TaxID=3121296 RepID=UPI00311E3AC9
MHYPVPEKRLGLSSETHFLIEFGCWSNSTTSIDNKHWTVVITYRGKSIRIISVRRARKSEEAIYES